MSGLNEPISELVAQNIYETLSEIKKSNGYHFDLVVERLGVHENEQGHLKLIINDVNEEVMVDALSGGYIEVTKDFDFELYILLSKGNTLPIARYINLIKADIQKAMYEDEYRGGYASDTNVGQDSHITNDDGKLIGFSFGYQVKYRYLATDPTRLSA